MLPLLSHQSSSSVHWQHEPIPADHIRRYHAKQNRTLWLSVTHPPQVRLFSAQRIIPLLHPQGCHRNYWYRPSVRLHQVLPIPCLFRTYRMNPLPYLRCLRVILQNHPSVPLLPPSLVPVCQWHPHWLSIQTPFYSNQPVHCSAVSASFWFGYPLPQKKRKHFQVPPVKSAPYFSVLLSPLSAHRFLHLRTGWIYRFYQIAM